MVTKRLIFIILILFSLPVLSGDYSTEQFIQQLQDNGDLSFFDKPAISIFKSTCGSSLSGNLTKSVNSFCEVIRSSDICEAVEEEDKIDCKNFKDSKDFDVFEFISGCAEGVVDFGKEMLNIAWSILKWIFDKATHPIKTYQEASEYVESTILYLTTEYRQVLRFKKPPFKVIKSCKRNFRYHRKNYIQRHSRLCL